jgi:predicted TIM-barrel fold metal-dependent hydrolase
VPTSRTQPPAGLYAMDSFRVGAATLASMGLSYEAWQYHPQLGEVAELARAVPELSIVLNHIGARLGSALGPANVSACSMSGAPECWRSRSSRMCRSRSAASA